MIRSGDRSLDAATLDTRARRAASGFTDLGIGADDCIALLVRNDFVFFECTAAAAFVGAYVVPLNWHFRGEELAHVLRDCGARAVVVHADLLPLLDGIVPDGVSVIVVATPPEIGDAYNVPAAACGVPSGAVGWSAWRDSHAPIAGEPRPPRVGIIYTSGTTGKPKGVRRQPVDAEMAARMSRLMGTALGLVPGEAIRTVITGPIYHSAPNVYATVAARLAELIVLAPRFDPEALLAMIERHRITHLHAVPIMFVRLLGLSEDIRHQYDLSSLRFVAHGAAPCPPDIKRAMIEWWGPIIHEYYGGTETGGAVCHNSAEALARPGTVGRAMEGCAIRIVAPDGRTCAVDEPGEVYIRSANFPDFTYVGLPDARREVDDGDGFVTIGDIGYVDADGYLFLCDRARDVIISGGVNIYPAEIEGVFLDIPGIADAAVFGIPDREYGESVHAVIQPAAGRVLDPVDIRAAIAPRLAAYKVPRSFEFRDALPREDSGKIMKRRLRDLWWAGTDRAI